MKLAIIEQPGVSTGRFIEPLLPILRERLDVAYVRPRSGLELQQATQDADVIWLEWAAELVLFHLQTPERHASVVGLVTSSFQTLAVISAWNDALPGAYATLAEHCFYRPLSVPSDLRLQERVIPANPVKSLYLVHPPVS